MEGSDFVGSVALQGLLRRTNVLLAMTRVRREVRARCREVNHPEPFLLKRPTPPAEGNGGDCNLKGGLLLKGAATSWVRHFLQ